jgi:hypothetical protein
LYELDRRLAERLVEPFRKSSTGSCPPRGQAVDRMPSGGTLENLDDGTGEPLVLQGSKQRRTNVSAEQVSTQEKNKALLHQRFGKGMGADARFGDLGGQKLECGPHQLLL